MSLELFGSKSCPYTDELRADLEWKGERFVEYDVDADPQAMERMVILTKGTRTVPVLVEDGRVKQIGVNGRGCYL